MFNSTICRLKTVRSHSAILAFFHLKVLCISKLKQKFQLYKSFNKLFIGRYPPKVKPLKRLMPDCRQGKAAESEMVTACIKTVRIILFYRLLDRYTFRFAHCIKKSYLKRQSKSHDN